MEHSVQFGIGIDDDSIRANVEKNAEKVIIADIKQEVMNKLFESGYYRGNARSGDPLSDYSKQLIEGFLEKHKDEILDKTAKYLADKLVRTKAAKELLNGEKGENK